MIHDIKQIKSLEKFVENNKSKGLPYDELFNNWIRETGAIIQDADTVDYYISLIPMIERRATCE